VTASIGSFLVGVPFVGVPVALVIWALYQVVARNAPVKALIGLTLGAAACYCAFWIFFALIYCENCSGKPKTWRNDMPVFAYFMFGLAMLAVLWWTARPRERTTAPGVLSTNGANEAQQGAPGDGPRPAGSARA
jgi:hypothetical protein